MFYLLIISNITCLVLVNYVINRVVFESSKYLIEDGCLKEVIFIGNRKDNVYTIDVKKIWTKDKCFLVLKNDSWLWHWRLRHASMSIISTLSKKNFVDGLPSFVFEKKVCEHVNLLNK